MSFVARLHHMIYLYMYLLWESSALRKSRAAIGSMVAGRAGSFNATSHYRCHHCQRRSCWAGWGPPFLLLHSSWQASPTPWCTATACIFLGKPSLSACVTGVRVPQTAIGCLWTVSPCGSVGMASIVSDLMVRRFPYCVWPFFWLYKCIRFHAAAIASRFERFFFRYLHGIYLVARNPTFAIAILCMNTEIVCLCILF